MCTDPFALAHGFLYTICAMEDQVRPRPRTRLSREQMAACILLIVLGVVGLGLGFASFGSSIRNPINAQIEKFGSTLVLTTSEKEAAEQEAMKTRDTDGDGLVDYDEVYVFKTSAYLTDSDSDGFDDRTEVYSGNDPTCPVGKSCGRGETAANTSIPVAETPPETPGSISDLREPDDYLDLLASLPPEQLKTMLMQAGVPAEKLEGLSDDELKTLFAQALQQAAAENASDDPSSETVDSTNTP